MSILRNNTKRLIIVHGKKLIPGRASSDMNVEAVKKQYPAVAQMIAKGDITEITVEQAKAIEEDFESRSLADLKDYAAENGINIDGLKKKADIVAVIKAAKNKKHEGK